MREGVGMTVLQVGLPTLKPGVVTCTAEGPAAKLAASALTDHCAVLKWM